MRTCLSSLFSSETTLKLNHNFLIESLSHLLTAFLRQERQFNYIPAHRLGHFEFQTLRSPTVVHLQSAAVPQVKKLRKKIFYPQATSEALLFFDCHRFREKRKSRFCTSRILFVQRLTPQASSFKCIQALDSDDATRSTPTADYEFHPHVRQTERLRMQERACHSTTPYPVCRFQGWSTNDDHQGNCQN
jgi:hypothetical protein